MRRVLGWMAGALLAASMAASPAVPAEDEAPATLVLPAGLRLVIAVDETLNSHERHRGDRFRIRLDEAVTSEGVVLLPSGLTGEGEILHAEPAGDSGRPGELLLAARYLDYGGRRIPLKGWRLSAKGRETVTTEGGYIVYTGWPAVIASGQRRDAEMAADFDTGRAPGVAQPYFPPTPKRLETLPAGLSPPAPGKAQIVFYRPAGQVILNWALIRFGPGKGAEVGRLGAGAFLTIEVPPGPHEFLVSQEAGDRLFLEAEAGETYYVAMRIHTGLWAGHPNLYPVERWTFESSLGGMTRKKATWK